VITPRSDNLSDLTEAEQDKYSVCWNNIINPDADPLSGNMCDYNNHTTEHYFTVHNTDKSATPSKIIVEVMME
jgi:hypothetical protein